MLHMYSVQGFLLFSNVLQGMPLYSRRSTMRRPALSSRRGVTLRVCRALNRMRRKQVLPSLQHAY